MLNTIVDEASETELPCSFSLKSILGWHSICPLFDKARTIGQLISVIRLDVLERVSPWLVKFSPANRVLMTCLSVWASEVLIGPELLQMFRPQGIESERHVLCSLIGEQMTPSKVSIFIVFAVIGKLGVRLKDLCDCTSMKYSAGKA